jgi:hypothetical protein
MVRSGDPENAQRAARGLSAGSARPLLPRERIARVVMRRPRPPRPVPWGPLGASVLGGGVGMALLLLSVLPAVLLDALGVGGARVLQGLVAVVALGFLVDLGRLVRVARIARRGVLVTARVAAGPGERALGAARRRDRLTPHPTGAWIRDRVRMPAEASADEVRQSVLVHPTRPRVWATLSRLEPLEREEPPTSPASLGLPPVHLATPASRWAAALRAGYWACTVAVMGAALAAELLDPGAGGCWRSALQGRASRPRACSCVSTRTDCGSARCCGPGTGPGTISTDSV